MVWVVTEPGEGSISREVADGKWPSEVLTQCTLHAKTMVTPPFSRGTATLHRACTGAGPPPVSSYLGSPVAGGLGSVREPGEA